METSEIVIGAGVVDWVAERVSPAGFASSARGIGLRRGGVIVAGVVYENFNGANAYAHHAIEGRLTRRYIWTVCDYPFNQLKVKRVTGEIPEWNLKARKFAEHIGMKLEASLKDADPRGDILIYAARREDLKWLRSNTYRRDDDMKARSNEGLYKSSLSLAA